MKNKRSCVKLGGILTLLAGGLVIIGGLGFIAVTSYLSRQQKQASAQYIPPFVLVTEPASGISIPMRSYLTVLATTTGVKPIESVELWMDGELKETQKSDHPGGNSPFHANFNILVPSEGPHMLFVRAKDIAGLVGQSPPISLSGTQRPTEVYRAIELEEGQTLEKIAAENNVPLEKLQGLNQGLGNPPPVGAIITVPAPPEEGVEEMPAAAPPLQPEGQPVSIPETPMMQIASDKSPGILSAGQFLPELLSGKIGPPAAPSGLQAEVKGCKVTLRWDDNADDEENYYIYMVPLASHGFATPFITLKPSPFKGPAWHEFEAPMGGADSLWVEAANSYGGMDSNIVWIHVPENCPTFWSSGLDISLLDLSVAGGYDKVYCYVSFEGSPESRIPAMSSDFFAIQNGKAEAYLMPTGLSQGSMGDLLHAGMPIPGDGSMDTSGECWGWSGGALNKLGTFSSKFPTETWDGSRQTIYGSGGSFQFGISIKGNAFTKGFAATDPTLSAPYNVTESPAPETIWTKGAYPPARLLSWKWDGDPQKIEGFELFLNGIPYSSVGPELREKIVQPGEACGESIRWQVATKTGASISNLSAPFQYDQPPCQVYLRVRFDELNLAWTDDGFPNNGWKCDTLDAYFDLSVGNVTRSFWGGGHYQPLNCGTKLFSSITGGLMNQLYGPEPNAITIPLHPNDDVYNIWIQARVWDYDLSGDDLAATFSEHPMGAFYPQGNEKWSSGGNNCFTTYTTGSSITDEAKSTLTFSYAVYPNNCRAIPPAEGF